MPNRENIDKKKKSGTMRIETTKKFLFAQAEVASILIITRIGNTWEPSYPRNDNHNPEMFWAMNALLFVAGMLTLKHTPKDRMTVLNRSQTEEWKGWMQWAFIMYHYYRMWSVYNTIRVFVSSYVWMTGFGNFLYFDKKRDFTFSRMCSMWVRINYFPLLLVFCIGVPLHLFYIVPLHTVGFLVTMATCYLAYLLEMKQGMSYWQSRVGAVIISGLCHVFFYETNLKNILLVFGEEAGNEYIFRFSSDKYSAFLGILSGMAWRKIAELANFHHVQNPSNIKSITQIVTGILMIAFWWIFFGSISDKFEYNPLHPYIFWIPLIGFLLIRNSSKYLSEVHCTALDFFGRITLETYVLQFHLFMNNNVQHIPIVFPGSGPNGQPFARFLNMLLCGLVFVVVALRARKVTISTQEFVIELMENMNATPVNPKEPAKDEESQKLVEMTTVTSEK